MAFQPNSVTCSQGLALPAVPTASYSAPLFISALPGTRYSQFLKDTRAHVLPALSAWKAVLNFSSLTPPLLAFCSQGKHQFLRKRYPWPPIYCAHGPSFLSFGTLNIVVSYRQLCEALEFLIILARPEDLRLWAWLMLFTTVLMDLSKTSIESVFRNYFQWKNKWIIRQVLCFCFFFFQVNSLLTKSNSSWKISVNYLWFFSVTFLLVGSLFP